MRGNLTDFYSPDFSSEDAVDYFYLGKEPPSNLLKEKEAAKLEPGMGVLMAVDATTVEQALRIPFTLFRLCLLVFQRLKEPLGQWKNFCLCFPIMPFQNMHGQGLHGVKVGKRLSGVPFLLPSGLENLIL